MKITTIGIDLANNVFQLHGVDTRGNVLLRTQLKRDKVVEFFANLAPCMEACGSAHYWARQLKELGHTAKLMAPQFVRPYNQDHSSDNIVIIQPMFSIISPVGQILSVILIPMNLDPRSVRMKGTRLE